MSVEYINFNDEDRRDPEEYYEDVPATWHLPERLYMVVITEFPKFPHNPRITWDEYFRLNIRRDHSAEVPAFHWPTKNRIYRSRSAAQEKLQQFTMWGAKGHLVECTPNWEAIPDANARRARERSKA